MLESALHTFAAASLFTGAVGGYLLAGIFLFADGLAAWPALPLSWLASFCLVFAIKHIIESATDDQT